MKKHKAKNKTIFNKGKQNMSKSIFREYDIRGIYQKELNEQTVKK